MSLFTFNDLRADQQRVITARIRKTLESTLGAGNVPADTVDTLAAGWSGGLSDVPGVHLTLVMVGGGTIQTTLARSPRSLDACLVWHDSDSLVPVEPYEVADVVDTITGERVLTSVKGVPTPVVDVRATVDASTLPWVLHTIDGEAVEVSQTGRGRPSVLSLADRAGIDPGTVESVSRGEDQYEIEWTPKMRKVEEIED